MRDTERLRRTGFFALTSGAALLFALVGMLVAATVAEAKAPGTLVIDTASGAHRFTIEWATTPAEQEHGLMGRKHMAADHGMLFDFGLDQPQVFWMKNTPLSLDMIFIGSDGEVKNVAAKTEPFSLKMIPSGAPVRYVFEVKAGTAERLAIVKGSKVTVGGP